MKKAKFQERLQYLFDRTMARGTFSLICWLGLVAIFVILITALLVWIIGIGTQSYLVEQVWDFLLLMLEPDALTFGHGHWAFRLATLIIVFTSIFILSTLIGVITTGIDIKLQVLRKGRSKVLEKNHTVILGWSTKIFTVISELIVANENQKNPCIVILADRDKVQMEDEIGETCNTRVVCRRGSPMRMKDLDLVNLNDAKSIIILAPQEINSDVSVIKTLLAITKNPGRKQEPYHIVAEICEERNQAVAEIIARGEVEYIAPNAFIGRIAAQACHQSGLSIVHQELLDFAGDEIYFSQDPRLYGKTYRQALFMFEDSALIGIKPENDPPLINPDMSTLIDPGDQIIAISEDDDTVIVSEYDHNFVKEGLIRDNYQSDPGPEHTLIIGWNDLAWIIIRELDHYVKNGSQLDLVALHNRPPDQFQSISAEVSNIECNYISGDTTDREVLEELDLARYNHVIILSYSDLISIQEADALSLITLLNLRDLADIHGYSFSIVSELLDVENQELAQIAKADDFIVSDRLISLVLSQISENKDLSAVFQDIFDPDGSEVYIKPISDYIDINGETSFYTLVEAAARKGETAIGYRKQSLAYSHADCFGIMINPLKSDLIQFETEDKLIVLAES
jgi:Trk K+ transport system NAD-binding subunit